MPKDKENLISDLAEQRTFSQMYFEHAPMGLNLCQMDGTWVESNPAFLKMLGYSQEEADGSLNYWKLTPQKYAPQEEIQLQNLEKNGSYGPYEKEFIRKNGTLVPVKLNGFIITRNGQKYIWSTIEDLSEKRNLERERESLSQQLCSVTESVPALICRFLLKPDGSTTMPYVVANGLHLFEVNYSDYSLDNNLLFKMVHTEDLSKLIKAHGN